MCECHIYGSWWDFRDDYWRLEQTETEWKASLFPRSAEKLVRWEKRFVVQLLLSFDEFPNSSPLTLTRCCNNELLLAYMGFELNHISPYQCIIAIVTISMSINRRSLYGTIRTPWALYRVFLIRCTNSRPLSSSEWLLTVAVSAAIRLITYPD